MEGGEGLPRANARLDGFYISRRAENEFIFFSQYVALSLVSGKGKRLIDVASEGTLRFLVKFESMLEVFFLGEVLGNRGAIPSRGPERFVLSEMTAQSSPKSLIRRSLRPFVALLIVAVLSLLVRSRHFTTPCLSVFRAP